MPISIIVRFVAINFFVNEEGGVLLRVWYAHTPAAGGLLLLLSCERLFSRVGLHKQLLFLLLAV